MPSTPDAATEARYRRAESARRFAQTSSVLAVEEALTEEERATILTRCAGPGTNLHGAKVADVLDIYANHDARLEWTEPFYEEDARMRMLYRVIGHDPDADLPDERDAMFNAYLVGITLSRAVLARALLMEAVPDTDSVQALAVKALEVARR